MINNPTHSTLNAAYSFYYATTAGLATDKLTPPTTEATQLKKERLTALMTDALILARQNDFDVLNALNLLDNALYTDDLKFGPGDGYLHFYLYNWRCRTVESDKLGLVML